MGGQDSVLHFEAKNALKIAQPALARCRQLKRIVESRELKRIVEIHGVDSQEAKDAAATLKDLANSAIHSLGQMIQFHLRKGPREWQVNKTENPRVARALEDLSKPASDAQNDVIDILSIINDIMSNARPGDWIDRLEQATEKLRIDPLERAIQALEARLRTEGQGHGSANKLIIHRKPPAITLDDTRYSVTEEQAEVVELLYNKWPARVTYKQMTETCPSLALQNHQKIGRDILDHLPEQIKARIDRTGGKGNMWLD
jgi:hypothetical protein